MSAFENGAIAPKLGLLLLEILLDLPELETNVTQYVNHGNAELFASELKKASRSLTLENIQSYLLQIATESGTATTTSLHNENFLNRLGHAVQAERLLQILEDLYPQKLKGQINHISVDMQAILCAQSLENAAAKAESTQFAGMGKRLLKQGYGPISAALKEAVNQVTLDEIETALSKMDAGGNVSKLLASIQRVKSARKHYQIFTDYIADPVTVNTK